MRTVAPRPASPGTMTESNTIQPNIAEGRNLATKTGGNSTLPLRRYECTWVPQKHPLASRLSGGRGVSLSRHSRDGAVSRPAAGAVFDADSERAG